MKRISLLALMAVLAAAAPLHAQTIPPGPKITIAASTQPGPSLVQYTKVDVPLLRDAIQQKSNGRIEVQLSAWPERSLNGPEVIRVVRSGQIDIGGAPLSTVSGDVPLLDGADLIGLNPEIAQARKVVDALIPVANKELERFNTKIVAAYPFSAQVIWCKQPLSGLSDLKGRKVRGFGPAANEFINAIGGQAAAIGFPEVYSALERGVVDCAITGSGSGNGVKWYEVTTHLYTLPVAWSVAGYFVNLNWWNKLDAPVRAFLEAQMKEIENAQWALGAEATQDGIDCNIGNAAGCKIHTLVTRNPMTEVKPTAADKAAVRKTLEDTVLPSWVKRCGPRCGDVYNETIAPITGVKYVAR
jgi:TRAP-type C4-dicarboxylate transport system substrate-binding protein